ncbi:HDOD domain-containing protein [Rhodoferax sp. GW822-FHT02A01]|uniref:HDOD domain-containing protein n=1 Tax=Rhodoferax sp. GW822-FHT02A01 TaxID=3141537 RepID=UPI00315D8A88
MNWFSWIRPVKKKQEIAPAAAAQPMEPRNEIPSLPEDVPDFLPWLLDVEPLQEIESSFQELRALEAVKKTLALPTIPQNLLPRANALVPQLIALMRESALPKRAVAERVSKDAKLTAEVMRLANSPYYRSQEEVATLMQAITLIGSTGLQTAIARVVLKPILQTTSNPKLADMEERLWEHSELVAQHAAALSPSAGLQSIEGYIAGLLYNTGWKVALRSLDQAGIALESPLSASFSIAMTEMAHQLFGLTTSEWEVTPGFTSFSVDAREFGLRRSKHPMTRVLQSAQAIAMGEIVSGMSQTMPAPLL